jgi:hypothetical protein
LSRPELASKWARTGQAMIVGILQLQQTTPE